MRPPPPGRAPRPHLPAVIHIPLHLSACIPLPGLHALTNGHALACGTISNVRLNRGAVVGVYNYAEVGTSDETMDVAVALDDAVAGAGGSTTAAAYTTVGSNQKQCVNVSSTQPCTVSFFIKPSAVGRLKVGVSARSPTQADAAVRTVLVKPDGIEHSYTENKFLELAAGETVAQVCGSTPVF